MVDILAGLIGECVYKHRYAVVIKKDYCKTHFGAWYKQWRDIYEG